MAGATWWQEDWCLGQIVLKQNWYLFQIGGRNIKKLNC